MRHFDIIKWLWVAGIIYTFLQGYTFICRDRRNSSWLFFLCAFCNFPVYRRLHTLYYLHMKMKNIDKLNGRAFERYLTVQFRHLGYHVTLTSYSHDYGADLVLRKWGKKDCCSGKTLWAKCGKLRLFRKLLVLLLITKLIGQWLLQNSNFTEKCQRSRQKKWSRIVGKKRNAEKISYKSLSSARWKLEKPVGGILGRGQENTECLGNENLLDWHLNHYRNGIW